MFRDNLNQVANEGRLITVRDRRIRLYEEGTGPTAVVIVTGAGDCADSWLPIRHHLASSYCIISYDRAAIGGAQDVAPATVDRYLTELGAVVNTASPQDQVVIAGHSLGGLIARLYQYAHPDRVSGLVLLDATPEPVADDRGVQAGFIASSVSARLFKLLTPLGFTRLLLKMRKMPLYPEQPRYKAAVSDAKYERWITMVCNSFGRGAGAELRSVIPTARQAKKLLVGHKLTVPLAVVASKAFGDKWVNWQRGLAGLSPDNFFTFTGTRSHNIHLRHPDIVTSVIMKIGKPNGRE